MKIIALTGWSESGKDTVADILVNSYRFKKYAIASPLKDLCSSLYGFPRELADTQEGKRTVWKVGYETKTIRDLLLETAILDRSRFGDTVYINEIIKQLSMDKAHAVVISDLRYFTELNAIQKYATLQGDFFEVWRVVREDQLESPVNDSSEYGLMTLKPHQTIENDGKSFEVLEKNISDALSRRNVLPSSEDEDDGCCVM